MLGVRMERVGVAWLVGGVSVQKKVRLDNTQGVEAPKSSIGSRHCYGYHGYIINGFVDAYYISQQKNTVMFRP